MSSSSGGDGGPLGLAPVKGEMEPPSSGDLLIDTARAPRPFAPGDLERARWNHGYDPEAVLLQESPAT